MRPPKFRVWMPMVVVALTALPLAIGGEWFYRRRRGYQEQSAFHEEWTN